MHDTKNTDSINKCDMLPCDSLPVIVPYFALEVPYFALEVPYFALEGGQGSSGRWNSVCYNCRTNLQITCWQQIPVAGVDQVVGRQSCSTTMPVSTSKADFHSSSAETAVMDVHDTLEPRLCTHVVTSCDSSHRRYFCCILCPLSTKPWSQKQAPKRRRKQFRC